MSATIAAWCRRALAAVVTAAATLAPVLAQAQAVGPPAQWTSATGFGCASCHNNSASDSGAPAFASNAGNGFPTLVPWSQAPGFQWYSSLASFTTRINAGQAGAMTSLAAASAGERQAVFDYLLAVRNTKVYAVNGSATVTSTFPNATVGGSATGPLTVRIENYRGEALNYTITRLGDTGDFCASSNCLAAFATAGTVSAQSTSTISVHFRPQLSSTASRSITFRITYTSGTTVVPAPVDITLTGTALMPAISVGGWSQAFTAQVGLSVTATATVSNGGSANLSLSNITFSGAGAGDYSLRSPALAGDCAIGSTVSAGTSCTLAVRFAPTALAGSHSGQVNLTHNAVGSPTALTLTGSALQGTLAVSSSTLAYGNVLQGSNSSQSFTLSNTGTAAVSGLGFTIGTASVGDTPGDFTRSGGTCGTTLNAGASCTVQVTFTPSTAAVLNPGATSARAATLTVSSNNASNASAPTVRLTGTSVGLANPTASTPAAFPSTLVGTTSATTRVVTLTNTRANPVTYSLAVTGTNAADFTSPAPVESCQGGGRVIAGGGGSCTVTFSFTPAVPGGAGGRSATATFNFTGSGADPSPPAVPVALSGTATTAPGFAISATSLALASVVNTASTPGVLTVSNTGTANLVLSSLTLGGSFPADYTLGGTCTAGGTVAPGGNCTVSVTFTPGAVGARGATLTLAHNDSTVNGGSTVVTLSGTGSPSLAAVLDLSGVSSLSFGDVLQGASSQLGFSIRNGNTNAGADALLLNGLSIVGAQAGDFTRGGTCTASTSLAGGQSCTVTVSFAPQAAGARSASVSISTTAAGGASVALSGNGVALADAALTGVPLAAFPSTLVTTTSATTRTLGISNPRANAVSYTAAFSGTNAGDFAVTSQSCPSRVVPGGGSCTVTVSFTPANGAAGARSATLGFTLAGTGADPAPAALATAVSGTAELPAPAFGISATALSFSAVVGSPVTRSAVVTNTGTATLALSGLSFSGTQASDFALDASNSCTATTTLAPAAACTLVVRYAPAAAGSGSAVLTLTSNAAGSPHAVALSGTATPAPAPRIALSALSLTFGSTQLGASSRQDITVQNTGDAALNFSAFVFSGAAAADYSRSGSCAVGTPLAPAAQCVLGVLFQPGTVGTRSAALAVQSDANNGNASVSLTGTAVPVPAPVVSLSAAGGLPLDFGAQTVGGLYPSRRLTLANTGTADLAVAGLVVEGAGFSDAGTGNCPATLAAGASCSIDVSFTPTAVQSYTGTLRVTSNAAGSPHTAALQGRGTAAVVPSLVWDPVVAQLDFGQVAAGTVSAVQSATLRNQGPGGVTITLLNALGLDSAAFSVTAGSCTLGQVLFEGQSCRIDVRFAPATAGAKTARVQVAGSGSAPADLVLAGTGLGGPNPGLALSTRALDFGSVRAGTASLPLELTLAANGSGVVQVTALTAPAGFTLQRKTCPPPPFSLQAGAECSVTLSFVPGGAGAASGQLTVVSDAPGGDLTVALRGQGEPEPDLSSGGCSLVRGPTLFDPTLWLLALAAVAGLAYRRRARARQRSGR